MQSNNLWIQFVKDYQAANPGLSYKEALIEAAQVYPKYHPKQELHKRQQQQPYRQRGGDMAAVGSKSAVQLANNVSDPSYYRDLVCTLQPDGFCNGVCNSDQTPIYDVVKLGKHKNTLDEFKIKPGLKEHKTLCKACNMKFC